MVVTDCGFLERMCLRCLVELWSRLVGCWQAADLGGSVESVLLGPVEARAVQGGSSIFALSRTGSYRGQRQRANGGGSSGGGGAENEILRRRGAELRAVC